MFETTQQRKFCTRYLIHGLCGIALLVAASTVTAAPFSVTRYVKIDHHGHSAYVFDENFSPLPENPYVPHTSIEVLPDDEILWYLGAKVDVVRKNVDGSIDVKSADPSYYEMNHHVVWVYHSENIPVTDDCGYNRPLAAGSELTDLRWPAGYGYKLHGGVIFPATWHWENPANVPADEEVYLRFTILLDTDTTAYKQTYVSWIDTVPCTSAFPVPSGEFEIAGPDYPVPVKSRIVAVYPHVHDHSEKLELQVNGEMLREFTAANAAIPVAHDDMGDGPVALHTHAQHLPTEGLTGWTPGVHGPVLQPGDSVRIRSEFNNPHDKTIDNMAIGVTIWEKLD